MVDGKKLISRALRAGHDSTMFSRSLVENPKQNPGNWMQTFCIEADGRNGFMSVLKSIS